jgi:phytoene dehydrogenase-like protein
VHDLCSAIHPLARGSPFFRTLPLEHHGLKWIQPPIALAHPLDDGGAACLRQNLAAPNDSLGRDENAWRQMMRPLVRDWEKLAAEFLQPMLHFPRHPLALARFGLSALAPAAWLARRRFRDERARALFAGLAAHSFLPLDIAGSAAFGLVLGAAVMRSAGRCRRAARKRSAMRSRPTCLSWAEKSKLIPGSKISPR